MPFPNGHLHRGSFHGKCNVHWPMPSTSMHSKTHVHRNWGEGPAHFQWPFCKCPLALVYIAHAYPNGQCPLQKPRHNKLLSLFSQDTVNEPNGFQPCIWHGWLHAHDQPQNHGRPLNINIQEPHVSHLNATVKCPPSSPELLPFQCPCPCIIAL